MKITKDKLMHFVAGYCIAATINPLLGALSAVVVTIIIALAKEVFDKATDRGTPELLDIIATVAGCLIYNLYYCIIGLWI